MGGDIQVRLDTSQFEQRLEFASREGINAMRRAVDKAARSARRETIKTMAADIGRPASAFMKSTPLVKASTQGNLSASWTVTKAKLGILDTGKFTPILSALRGSFSGSTFRLSGGGSASLNLPKAFILYGNGGRALMVRTGKGRAAIKAVYAEHPATGLGTEGDAPRVTWQKVAERELNANIGVELQRAFDGAAGPSPSSLGGE